MTITPALLRTFAPTGTLRASINLGNPILASQAPGAAQPHGVSVDLAGEFAKRLGLPLELVVFDAAGKSVAAVAEERADFGFFAVDPARGESIAFTAPYVLIEGAYMVRQESPLQSNGEVDVPGRTVVVGKASAYDLYLTREIRHASLERAATSQAVVDHFMQGGFDVAAGVKQQLESDAQRVPGVRLLPGRFMVIQQAMGLPKSRGPEAAAELARFVEEMKASGFVAKALQRHGIQGASVAPAA
ncbi:ABC transporter substrate-binding protein [Caenimonas aquaedulcis]|uniref:ABC transporter substrate-binding protein n=1 Tax=Caenimonas aquaedulcis TaxID=2793270 RepID=A0A931H532_9BURK|nr:ABC transporter substrate-binding protein [Caenimonas aquaedulcis]MBG9388575.1 ABC transporter substrate-binding protein [Caenimonas aquaedulcis]